MQPSGRDLRLSVKSKVIVPLLLIIGVVPLVMVAVEGKPDLRSLNSLQVRLLAVSASVMVACAVILWLFANRLSRLLREIRDKADIVGRGDFSKRVEHFSNDECGDLAETFNQMTANLQRSRLDLEKAADSLSVAQAQLVQSEKLSAVGQFVSGVAHELNNPLTLVIGFSDLLIETEVDEKIRPRLEIIAKSAHRCHRIVENLLGFARQHKQNRKLVQITDTIDEVLELMAYDLKTSNIEIIRDFPKGLPPIMADPHQLQQVFVNLIGNARQAIQAAQPAGKIIARARAKAGYLRVELADDGPGISPENIRKIFEPFFTTKPKGKGTGLGLSLVLGIVQEHAGRIDVESEVGHGATFIVELPVAAETAHAGRDAALKPARPPGQLLPPGSSGKAILIVDDEEWILTLAQELVGSNGHAAEPARNGEEALAAIQRRDFDAIVLDWKMPGMNGVQFYERLLELKPHLARRVIFMSGDIIDETFQAFLARHEKKCLAKPFPIDEFREEVEKILSLAWSRQSPN